MQDLLDISEICEQIGFGGTVTLEYLPIEEIETFPEGFDLGNFLAITNPIVPITGKDWKKVMVYPDTVRFKEDSDDSNQGPSIKTKLTASFPTNRNEYRRTFSRMRRHRFILKMENSNKDTIIVGSPQTPLTFAASLDQGAKIPDGHIFNLEFNGLTEYLSFIYTV